MKSILYVGGFELPDKNAAAQRVLTNAKAFRNLGYNVSFIGITKSNDYYGNCEGFNYSAISYPNNLSNWFSYTIKFIPLDIIKSYSPDIIIAYNYPAIPLRKLISYCKKHQIKLIGDITEWYVEKGWNLRSLSKRFDTFLRMRCFNKRLNSIIAISEYLYNYYKEYTQTVQIPPLVDLSSEKWNIKKKYKNDNLRRLVFAGTIGASKDQIFQIIDSVKKFDNILLYIAGISEDQYSLNKEDIPNNIHFLGRISHNQVLKLLKEVDFQIFLRDNNLANKAGFPTKFVESYASSLPVITTKTSDLSHYLYPGINGFFVDEENNILDILDKISKLSNLEIKEMSEYISNHFAFDYHNFMDRFNSIVK